MSTTPRLQDNSVHECGVIFILDGLPSGGETCCVKTCFAKATGMYEVCDAETCRYLFSVALCKAHGEKLCTGVAA